MMRRPMFRARDVVVPANRRRSGQSGMGLIELMIAMVVLLVGMLGSMIMVIAGMQSNTRNRNDTSAVVLDQEILEKFATLKNYPKTGVAIINDCALAGTNQHLAALVQAPAPGAGAVLFTAGTAPTPVQVGVFRSTHHVMQGSQAEQVKVDLTQQAREFVDEFERDVHQAGYPNCRMISTPGAATNCPPDYTNPLVAQNASVAAGLVLVSNTEVIFEGDVDGDGVVDTVVYRLVDQNLNYPPATTCPCTIQRSQMAKVAL